MSLRFKLLTVACVALLSMGVYAPAALADDDSEKSGQSWLELELQKQQLAEEQLAKTSVAIELIGEMSAQVGREFDADWAASKVEQLAHRSMAELDILTEELQHGVWPQLADGIDLAGSNKALGDTTNDLVFHPISPGCRAYFSTNATSPSGPLMRDASKAFRVAGGLSGQGGSTGCGVPFGPAKAVLVNLVVNNAQGSGNLQVWPTDSGSKGDSAINFPGGPGTNFNLINSFVTRICDTDFGPCADDLNIELNFAPSSDVGVSVAGYFTRAPVEEVKIRTAREDASSTVSLSDGTCKNYLSVTITAPTSGTIVVNANAWMRLSHSSGTNDDIYVAVKESNSDCSLENGITMAHHIPSAYPSDSEIDITIPTRRVANVSAGTHTFYLNGNSNSGASAGDVFWFADMVAQFFPD